MRFFLASLLLISLGWQGAANAQATFLLGIATGMALSGPEASSSPEGTASNVLYLAPVEVRRAVDPLDVRISGISPCINGNPLSQGVSVRQTIHEAMSVRQRTVGYTVLMVRLSTSVTTGQRVCPNYLVFFTSTSN